MGHQSEPTAVTAWRCVRVKAMVTRTGAVEVIAGGLDAGRQRSRPADAVARRYRPPRPGNPRLSAAADSLTTLARLQKLYADEGRLLTHTRFEIERVPQLYMGNVLVGAAGTCSHAH